MIYKSILFCLIFLYAFFNDCDAQCSNDPKISIVGSTCAGSILTATSSVDGANVVWKKDGQPVSTQRASFTDAGITEKPILLLALTLEVKAPTTYLIPK